LLPKEETNEILRKACIKIALKTEPTMSKDKHKERRITVLGAIICVLGALFVVNKGRTNPAMSVIMQSMHGEKEESDAAQKQAPENKDVTFRLELMSDGVTSTGDRGHTDRYTSSDGHVVYVTYIKYDSQFAAIAALQPLAKPPYKVLQRSVRMGKDGLKVGERVLAQSPNGVGSGASPNKTYYSLTWTNGAVFRDINSDSRDDVLAMEKFLKLE
jgi:hypothetical protein